MIAKRNVMNRMNNFDDEMSLRDELSLKDSCARARSGALLSSTDRPNRLRGVEESDLRDRRLAVCGALGFHRRRSCVETSAVRYGGRGVEEVATSSTAPAQEEGNVVQRVEEPHLFRLDGVSGLVHQGKSRQEEEVQFGVLSRDYRNRQEGIHQSRRRNLNRYRVSD